jgi:hypothetical protein
VLRVVIATAIWATIGSQVDARPFTRGGQSHLSAPDPWHQLLDAFVQHDSRAKELVDKAVNESQEASVRALAAVLQEEWQLPPNSDVLTRPRAIDVPKIKPGDAEGSAESFVFHVEVSPDGRVITARFAKTPKQVALAKMARANVLRALFCPAFDGRRFVTHRFVMKYSFELR